MRGVMNMSKVLDDLPAPYVEYIENPGQWPNFARALVSRGYADGDIGKILGENVLRLLRQTIG
jgi:microsomal dipeptidase-like Zn-dependent dipeptidase